MDTTAMDTAVDTQVVAGVVRRTWWTVEPTMRDGMMPTAQCVVRSPSMDEVKAVYHVEIEQQDRDDDGGRGSPTHPTGGSTG